MNKAETTFQKVSVNEIGAPEVSPQELQEKLGDVQLIDVRRPDEFNGELAHIKSAKLITLETDFEKSLSEFDPSKTYVFVCRSGGRSSQATLKAREKGISNSFNMEGGMLKWNALDFPIEKS